MVVLLGQNNHGKSNIIGALDFALNSSKPNRDDLFAFAKPDDKEIWVEVSFDRLTDEEETTWQRYVQDNGTFRFRKTASFDDEDKVNIKYNGYVSEPDEEWLKADNVSNYTKHSAVSETPLKSYIPKSGQITKAKILKAQEEYIREHRADLDFSVVLEKGPLLGKKNVAKGLLPEFFLVPAVRDLDDESKVRNTALFGKLLTYAVSEMASMNPLYRNIEKQLDQLVSVLNAGPKTNDRPQQLTSIESSIQQELTGWDARVSLEVTPPDISKIFELGTEIYLDDGLKTLAKHKGHGLQRAVIFGLMKAWAKVMGESGTTDESMSVRRSSRLVVFGIEEPELFLHPHAQRTFNKALRELSEGLNSQVIISSHSTHFVDLDDYRGIALIRKESAEIGTISVQCTEDLFEGEDDQKRRFNMATWVNPDRGEMLFAHRVAFVEGETEKLVFPFLAEKMGCHSEDVSVIDCGSKNNIPLYVTIAKAFQLNYVVVHDEDPIPANMSSRFNVKIEELVGESGSVAVLQPDFEHCGQVPRNDGRRKGKPLAALDYFASVKPDDIPPKLADVIRLVYAITR